MDKLPASIKNYAEFWPYYLREHSKRQTRRFHVVGTLLGILWFGFALFRGYWAWAPLGFIIGYGFAWVSHFFIEKNRPATFRYPWWSFISDFKLLFWVLSGRMKF